MGFDVYMECTVSALAERRRACAGALATGANRAASSFSKRSPSSSPPAASARPGEVTSNSWEYTGDGMALAYEAGAELMDMEFVQFHPTGMVWPPGVQGILVTEAVRGEGGILRNKKGERFMESYDPKRMELSTRDVVARSIYTEVREGRGTEHGGAYLDISHKPAEYVKRKLPSMYHQFKELADVDITKGPMEVGPTCHYMMGGIRVEAETAQSTVPGLFAAGEAAAGLARRQSSGWQFAFGSAGLRPSRRSGRRQARQGSFVRGAGLGTDRSRPNEKRLRHFSAKWRESLRHSPRFAGSPCRTWWAFFAIAKTSNARSVKSDKFKQRLAQASVEGSRMFNPGWHLALELKAMLTVAEAVTQSALVREESRGAHSRIDFPNLDPVWGTKNNVISAGRRHHGASAESHAGIAAGIEADSAEENSRQNSREKQERQWKN